MGPPAYRRVQKTCGRNEQLVATTKLKVCFKRVDFGAKNFLKIDV
jgi:hypothetical protein